MYPSSVFKLYTSYVRNYQTTDGLHSELPRENFWPCDTYILVSGFYAADLGMEEPVKATATSETLSILDTQPYVVHRTIAPKQKIKTLKVICCIQFTSQVVTHWKFHLWKLETHEIIFIGFLSIGFFFHTFFPFIGISWVVSSSQLLDMYVPWALLIANNRYYYNVFSDTKEPCMQGMALFSRCH